MYLLASVLVTDNKKTLAYYKICPIPINYESIMFIVQAPGLVSLNLPRKFLPNLVLENCDQKTFINSFSNALAVLLR